VLRLFLALVLGLCPDGLVNAAQHPSRHDDGAELAGLSALVILIAGMIVWVWRSGTLLATPESGIRVRTIPRTR
jgi:hypothetical protein